MARHPSAATYAFVTGQTFEYLVPISGAIGRPLVVKHIEDVETDNLLWDAGAGAMGQLAQVVRQSKGGVSTIDLKYDGATSRLVSETVSIDTFSAERGLYACRLGRIGLFPVDAHAGITSSINPLRDFYLLVQDYL